MQKRGVLPAKEAEKCLRRSGVMIVRLNKRLNKTAPNSAVLALGPPSLLTLRTAQARLDLGRSPLPARRVRVVSFEPALWRASRHAMPEDARRVDRPCRGDSAKRPDHGDERIRIAAAGLGLHGARFHWE